MGRGRLQRRYGHYMVIGTFAAGGRGLQLSTFCGVVHQPDTEGEMRVPLVVSLLEKNEAGFDFFALFCVLWDSASSAGLYLEGDFSEAAMPQKSDPRFRSSLPALLILCSRSAP